MNTSIYLEEEKKKQNEEKKKTGPFFKHDPYTSVGDLGFTILGVPIQALLENPRQCPCRQLSFDPYGDHIQTCQSHHFQRTNGSCIVSV
jgi:hypothetical protein